MGNKYLKYKFLGALDPYEVTTLIDIIKRINSSGHDGITPTLIKHIKYEISYQVPILINKYLFNGILPELLKIIKVIQIFKSID